MVEEAEPGSDGVFGLVASARVELDLQGELGVDTILGRRRG
jgi:hypothetical protein